MKSFRRFVNIILFLNFSSIQDAKGIKPMIVNSTNKTKQQRDNKNEVKMYFQLL